MAFTRQQALEYFSSDDLIGIGMEADALRRRLHPESVATYTLDCNICYAPEGAREDRFLDFETIYDRIAESQEMGATSVLMHGDPHLELSIEWFERLLRGCRQRFPSIWLHCFSAAEILAIAQHADLSLHDTILRLRDAGLQSIPGDSAEILDDSDNEVIRTGRAKYGIEDWVAVHRTAHELGIRTTASMTFGRGETIDDRINYLGVVRRLQEETGGFAAFIPVSIPASRSAQDVTSVEYLKVLAVARLYLDNIENIQSSWATQGPKVLQMGLRFGGNDVGSVMPEQDARFTTEESLRRIIREAGFRPAQRDTLYTTMFLN